MWNMAESKPPDMSDNVDDTDNPLANERMSTSDGNGTSYKCEAYQKHIEHALDCFSKMEMAHEISLSTLVSSEGEFIVSKNEKLENCLELVIKSLAKEPPDLKLMADLLIEIKHQLSSLFLSDKKYEFLEDGLDVEMINKQGETGTLDLTHYINVLISTMLKMCAPKRDGDVKKLTEITDPAIALREICNVLYGMKTDHLQFLFGIAKPLSFDYEKEQFDKFVQMLGTDVALENTRQWLEETCQKSSTTDHKKILDEAFMQLLSEHHNEAWPETFMLDREKIANLRKYKDNLRLKATIYLIVRNTLRGHLPNENIASVEEEIGEDISCLLDDKEPLCTVSGHIVDLIKKKHLCAEDTLSLLKAQIDALEAADHSVAKVVDARLTEYIKHWLEKPDSTDIPNSLLLVKDELKELCSNIGGIFHHNQTMFGRYYKNLLQNALDE